MYLQETQSSGAGARHGLKLSMDVFFSTSPEVSLTNHARLKEKDYEAMNITFGLRAPLKRHASIDAVPTRFCTMLG